MPCALRHRPRLRRQLPGPGRLAAEAGARRLLLTHLWPITDRVALRAEAEAAYGATVELVRAGSTYVV